MISLGIYRLGGCSLQNNISHICFINFETLKFYILLTSYNSMWERIWLSEIIWMHQKHFFTFEPVRDLFLSFKAILITYYLDFDIVYLRNQLSFLRYLITSLSSRDQDYSYVIYRVPSKKSSKFREKFI